MNKLLLCLLFLFSVLVTSAQKVYFIYIQSDTEQPFYVKLGSKTYSSSASGYLILSRLYDSTYNFTIGFAQNKWPEQSFTVIMVRKDHGYLLKNFGEKGWGLFDLQTLTVQMSSTGSGSKTGGPAKTGTDVSVFTELLSKASDDPSLKEKPVQPPPVEVKKSVAAVQEVVKKEEPKKSEPDPSLIKSTEIAKQTPEKKDEPKKSGADSSLSKSTEIAKQAPEKKGEPKKSEADSSLSKSTDISKQPAEKKDEPKTEMKEQVPVKPVETDKPTLEKTDPPKTEMKKDEAKTESKEIVATESADINQLTAGKKDTVKTEIKDPPPSKVEEQKPVVIEYKRSVVTKKSESSTTQGFGLTFIDDYGDGAKDTINILIPNPKPLVTAVKEQPKEEKKFLDINTEANVKKDTATAQPVSKNNCQVVADENDFFSLRKNMASAQGDDNMINEARNYFKQKCFTTAQTKNLSSLFLTNEGKYKFFDAVYNNIADPGNFASLQAELSEELYINRFKAMLRN